MSLAVAVVAAGVASASNTVVACAAIVVACSCANVAVACVPIDVAAAESVAAGDVCLVPRLVVDAAGKSVAADSCVAAEVAGSLGFECATAVSVVLEIALESVATTAAPAVVEE